MNVISYTKQSTMKDSGVDWLGDIPSSWKVVKLRFIADITTGDKDTENNEPDGQYPFYVRSQTVERISSFSHDGEAILTAGDGVGVCKVWHYALGKFDFHQRVYMLYNFRDVDGRYLFHYIKNNFIHDVLKQSLKSTVDSLRRPMFLDFPVALPAMEDQKRIAAFLDHQTGLIDELIEKNTKLLALLDDQRKAIINEAVTKGLDPKAPMKDSGVEWLGAVPTNWAILPLRALGSCQNGVSAGAEYFGEGTPFVSYGDVYKNYILPAMPSGKARSTKEDQEKYSIEEGDVLFTRTSETIEEIGIASTCLETIPEAVFAGFLIRFRPFDGRLFPGFSKYFFRSNTVRAFLSREVNLVTRASLSQELLKRLPVCVPSLREQRWLAERIDEQVGRIDELEDLVRASIEQFALYRQSLISEAVTGKIDLREWVPAPQQTVEP